MRTIKFRFWEKPDASVNFEGKMHYDSDEYFNKWCGHPDYETMQFTGLFDRNGKEIYEGDVGKDGDDGIYEVKFDDGAFVSVYDTNVIEYLSESAKDIEVIGNIYENPDLIKKDK